MNRLRKYITSLSKETKWNGNHSENGTHPILKAGRLSMVYDNGNLRYISAGNHEIIRMIYPAVRDKAWLTVQPVISDEEFDIHPESFRISYRSLYKSGEINFSALFTVEGNPDNSLFFSLEGEALDNFEKNRIGFCVLHPVENHIGKSCIIEHTDDTLELSEFPKYISPVQPFTDIKSMRWKVSDLDCSLNFYGDVFETEDQRNWTDSSFKTYSTPLDKPFPVKLLKGEKIIQKIELKVEGYFETVKKNNEKIIINIYPDKTFEIPMIGIGRSTRPEPVSEAEIQNLRKLRFDHYRVDLYLFNNNWKIIAEAAASEADRLGYPVEFALFFDDNYAIQSKEFIDWALLINTEIACINFYHKTEKSTPDLLTDSLTPSFKTALPGVRTGSGTNSNFVEINRKRPCSVSNNYICYSIQPQEHASDNATLVENLQPQADTAESARQFAHNKKIWISPVNIQRRFNANITNYELTSENETPPHQVDSRLMSLFGACWTAGSIKYLIESGIAGFTFYETVGERGIMQGDSDSRWPENFYSVKGMIFPAYHIFFFLLKHKSFKVVKSKSSNPLAVDVFVLSDGKIAKIIAINFTASQQETDLKGCNVLNTIYQLNSTTYDDAVIDPVWIDKVPNVLIAPDRSLILEPFSVSFIDGRI